MVPDSLPRRALRGGYPDGIRFDLIDDDLDNFERRLLNEVRTIRRSQRLWNGIGGAILVSTIGALVAIALK